MDMITEKLDPEVVLKIYSGAFSEQSTSQQATQSSESERWQSAPVVIEIIASKHIVSGLNLSVARRH